MDLKGTYFELIQNKTKKQFVKELDEVIASDIERIKSQNKVRIAFQTSTVDEWIGDRIIKFFFDDKRFEVSIVYDWQSNLNDAKEREKFEKSFIPSGYNCSYAGKDVTPGDFDIIFFTTPYLSALEFFSSKEIPLSTLVCYIPYGFYLADIQDTQFNLFIHNICWKNYISSSYYLEMADKYCDVKRHGMVYSGYPKMDALLDGPGNIGGWKIPDRKGSNYKKIIYAPHHSINEVPYFSTFDKNYEFFLEYAKSHADSTSWIIKPHPLLGASTVKNGVFADLEGYYNYLKEWDDLSNARVVEGEYAEWFLSSDCMILDSVSFLAEYLYTGKPLLFLDRSSGGFNEFGSLILDCLYKVDGDDYEGIDSFLHNFMDDDVKAGERKEIFNRYLNYREENGVPASEYIYNDVVNSIFR